MPSAKRFATYGTVASVFSILAVAGLSFATLLGVLPGYPLLSYDASGVTTYDSIANELNVHGSPIAIRFSVGSPPRIVNPTGAPPSEVVQVRIIVDETGALVGGVPGDDLVIQGQVDADGNGSIDYSGVLLTGEILQFGHQETGTPTDFYDFRFIPTGGSLIAFFAGKHVGMTVTSEGSNFIGDFVYDFGGGAKGNVGPIDIPNHPPVCDAGSSYETQCAGGITTVSLDATQSHDEDNDLLTYSWTTDCPSATFDDASSATAVLSVDTSTSCEVDCTVTLTVSDGTADPVSCTATVHIEDSNPPIPVCPEDVTVECSQPNTPPNTGVATATDECDPSPDVTHTDSVEGGLCPQELYITRTWTATDSCGNSASCEQSIHVVDTTSPVITCPGNRTVTCQQGTTPAVTGTATATDNCDTSPTIAYTDDVNNGCCPTVAVITRTWTATDDCGNVATCTQTINVVDNSAPIVHCPPDITISCSQSTHPNVTGWATATDSCDTNPQVVYSDTWLCGECPRVLKRKWKAKDDCGNSSSWCYQIITVADTEPPVITCPPDVTKFCGESTSTTKTGRATATDNCDSCPTVTYTDQVSGSCPKTITRTWKAKDDCGNIATCVQTIQLNPVPPCPHTANYWKTHQNDWPVTQLTIGGVNYNSTKLMNMLRGLKPNGQAASGDASINLAIELIAAEFNLLNGSQSDGIDAAIDAAHNYFASHTPGCKPTGSARSFALTLADVLGDYNSSRPNGCDDDDDDNGCGNHAGYHGGCTQNHNHNSYCGGW